jgi:hypothetical protein
MTERLFPRFLHDQAEYDRAEAYWRELWDDLMRFTGQRGWQYPWLQAAYADGTPFRDGDPIFSAWSPSRKIGVRVIQNEPRQQDPELVFWRDVVGDEWTVEVPTLVISCALSQETADVARDLILVWIRDGAVDVERPQAGPLVVTGHPRRHRLLSVPALGQVEAIPSDAGPALSAS